jgi:hypothetical protein
MKIEFEYFKAKESQAKHKAGLKAYTKEKDAAAKKLPNLSTIQGNDQKHVVTPYGLFRIGAGNSKVHFPTISFEAGLTCSSQDICPFAYANKRAVKSKRPRCYAQKLEGAFASTFNAKVYQASVCEKIAQEADDSEMIDIAEAIALATKEYKSKYIRISEVGDIGPTVARFARTVLCSLTMNGMKPYLYTKRPEPERELFRRSGALVVVSEEDFVCVKTAEEAKALKLPICPGECGGPEHKCFRCPLGKKTAVIAH